MILLNLLPPEEKQKLRQKQIIRQIIIYEGILLFSIAFLAVLLQFSFLIIKWETFSVQEKVKKKFNPQEISQQEKNVNVQINKINQEIDQAIYFQENQKKWSQPIDEVVKSLSSGIYISQLNLVKENKIIRQPKLKKTIIQKNQKITISGIANNRNSLITTEGLLKKNNCFKEINSPISNYLKKEKINFSFDIIPKKQCLQ